MFSILLVRQGQTMERGTFVRWCIPEGIEFGVEEDLYEVETEKAVITVQTTRAGRIVKRIVSPHDSVAVGAVLAIAAEPGEVVTDDRIASFARQSGTGQASSILKEVQASDVAAGSPPRVVAAVPRARALACELGVVLGTLTGSGPDGVITAEDVIRASKAEQQQEGGAASARHREPCLERRVALTPIWRATIRSVEASVTIPQFTQSALVDVSRLARQRGTPDNGLSYMDFFIDAVVRAAKAVPDIACRMGNEEIHYLPTVDVSIATNTERGLLLPVLRDAGRLSTEARAVEWRRLVERARQGESSPVEMTGGVIAISSIGATGVDLGVALLPLGHSAIVFFGKIAPRAVVVEEHMEARQTIYLSITYDHRLINGVLAAQYTNAVREHLESGG